MKSALSLILLCLITSTLCVDEEDKVLVLDDTNFDEELKNHKVLLVEFYAPWCGHCKTLAPEYAAAAAELRNETPPVYLAKVDATVATELASRYSIEGFPTLKFWMNGEWRDYDGGRTSKDIVNWIKKKLAPATKDLKTVEDVEAFKSEHDVVVCLFSKGEGEGNANDAISEDRSLFVKIASKYEDVYFGIVSKELSEHYKVQPGQILLFKNFDEGKNKFSGEITEEALMHFINFFSIPVVSKFDERVAEAIFGRNKSGIFLVRTENNAKTIHIEEIFRKLAPQYREQLIFVVSDIIGEFEEKLAEYFVLTEKDLPHIRITDVKSEEDVRTYVLLEEITEDSLIKFIEGFFTGNLPIYVKSEEIPTEQTEAVIKVVGKSYKDIVFDTTKNVLIEYYAPWCGHCKELAPKYEQVAEHFKNDPSIVIAKIDATSNDTEGLNIEGYPSIKFFAADNKSEPVNFNGEREFDSLVRFVNELVYPDKYPSTASAPDSASAPATETEKVSSDTYDPSKEPMDDL